MVAEKSVLIRDVYFWSAPCGLLDFRGAEFHLEAKTARDGRESSPVAWMRVVLVRSPSLVALQRAVWLLGLLWTASPEKGGDSPYPGNQVHEVIPAMLKSVSGKPLPRPEFSVSIEPFELRLDWHGFGPYLREPLEVAAETPAAEPAPPPKKPRTRKLAARWHERGTP